MLWMLLSSKTQTASIASLRVDLKVKNKKAKMFANGVVRQNMLCLFLVVDL